MAGMQDWTYICDRQDVEATGKKVVKAHGKQILLLNTDKGLVACNNRCPHEGFPLSEGTLGENPSSKSCTLTCNWHNWKFDLESGETLVGGDVLRQYPMSEEDGKIYLDLRDPPAEKQRPQLLSNIRQAMEDYDYTRMARELARFEKIGIDPKEAVIEAVIENHNRFEYGMTHAYAAAADWVTLASETEDPSQRLTCFLEPINHIAWDSLREPIYPFTDQKCDWSEESFLAAVEAEDEDQAIAHIRGAMAQGLRYTDLELALAKAAFAHYADFGHSAIYVYKTGSLIDQLGDAVLEPVLFSLVRGLTYQTREDLIPEFRSYADALSSWQEETQTSIEQKVFRGLSIRQALSQASASEASYQSLFTALMDANIWNFGHFDLSYESHTDLKVTDNVGWLDFTHGITFANAVRNLCTRHPELWPQGLLQMACFSGRNASYTDREQGLSQWQGVPLQDLLQKINALLFDHAQFEPIVSGHLIKLLRASEEELAYNIDAPWQDELLTALNRFYHTPVRRRHVTRTVKQARDFVELED